jgi:hypothetical protein
LLYEGLRFNDQNRKPRGLTRGFEQQGAVCLRILVSPCDSNSAALYDPFRSLRQARHLFELQHQTKRTHRVIDAGGRAMRAGLNCKFH